MSGERCKVCNRELEEEWRYCPHCGTKRGSHIPKPPFSFVESLNTLDLVEKIFADISNKNEGKKGRKTARLAGFGVFITTQPGEEADTDLEEFSFVEEQPAEQTDQGKKARVRPPPRFVREPETRVEMRGDKLVLRMDVPGIKSVEDVETYAGSESLEVKAYAGDMAYFKVIRTPGRVRRVSKRIEGTSLILEAQV